MAQAKKPTNSASKPKPARTAPKAPPAKTQTAPAAPNVPAVDPGQSAATAAAMVARNAQSPAASSPQPQKSESAIFRQMKDSLNKPHSQIMGGLLDKIGSTQPKKSSLPFGGGKQVGHDQTSGSDAIRRNVPRRTGG
ncbi:MAG: hypothetical protein ABSF29_11825 [Tepidisphaeraceae bacterium]|jgi:hypothetical protein